MSVVVNMGWNKVKEFLRPTLWKILITLMLFFPIFIDVISQTSGMYIECGIDSEGHIMHPESCGYIEPPLGFELDLAEVIVARTWNCTVPFLIDQ